MSDDQRLSDEVREAMRSDDEELSPGFYARTVARFDATRQSGARLPFGLTWSTAGLAAAAIFAAAIFIPMALRDEIPGMPEAKPLATREAADKLDIAEPKRAVVGAD